MKSLGAFHRRLTLLRFALGRGRVLSFLRGGYGPGFSRISENYLRKCELVCPVLRLVFRCSLGILFFPLVLCAQLTSIESNWLQNINAHTESISHSNNDIRSYLDDVRQDVDYLYAAFGYTSLYTLKTHLEAILAKLNDINGSLSSSSSSTDLSTIEDTLNRLLTNSNANTDALANIDQGGLNWANTTGKSIPYWLKYNSDNTSQIRLNSDTIVSKLDIIIAALQSGSSGGDEGSTETITQDWLKEETFTTARAEDNAATKQYRDWFKSAFGFGGSSSSPSLKDTFFPSVYRRWTYSMSDPSFVYEPMPGSSEMWPNTMNDTNLTYRKVSVSSYSFLDILSHMFALNSLQTVNGNIWIAKKQSWNDWQAHTNLVANLWAIHNSAPPTGDVPTIGLDENGVLTYRDGGASGSSTEPLKINLMPSTTNRTDKVVGDLDTLEAAARLGTSTGENPIDTAAIRARYFAYLDIAGADTDIGADIGSASSSSSEVMTIKAFGQEVTIDLAEWGTAYRGAMTKDKLSQWRSVMGVIWSLFAWTCGLYIAKRLANME